jgi:hypothetical protein
VERGRTVPGHTIKRKEIKPRLPSFRNKRDTGWDDFISYHIIVCMMEEGDDMKYVGDINPTFP